MTRSTKTKECKQCGHQKLLSEFPTVKSKSGKKYYRGICKLCRYDYEKDWKDENIEYSKEYHKEYYKKHRDKILKRVTEWQTVNREYKLAYQRAWYIANQPRLLKKQRNWYEQNPEKVQAYQRENAKQIAEKNKRWRKFNKIHIAAYNEIWREDNREHTKEYAVQYRKEKPEIKRLSESKRRARLKGGKGHVSVEQIMELLAVQRGVCIYCGTLLKDGYEMDHIIPLSRKGDHYITNIQLLCSKCNRIKHAKTHEEYIRKLQMKNKVSKRMLNRVRYLQEFHNNHKIT